MADQHRRQAPAAVPGLASAANRESPRTTKLYDLTNDAISLDEIERILIQASASHRSRRITAQAPATLERSIQISNPWGWVAPVLNSLLFALQHFYFPENVPGIFVAFIPISYIVMVKKNWRIGVVVHSLFNLWGVFSLSQLIT